MSIRILWRSAVFIITLTFIYLAYPILIVPSSLPAIQAMFIQNQFPEDLAQIETPSDPDRPFVETEAQIYQLSPEAIPTLKDKITILKQLHQQGMDKILIR